MDGYNAQHCCHKDVLARFFSDSLSSLQLTQATVQASDDSPSLLIRAFKISILKIKSLVEAMDPGLVLSTIQAVLAMISIGIAAIQLFQQRPRLQTQVSIFSGICPVTRHTD